MIPIPTSRVFRSRRGALLWAFWVIVAAVMAVGFGDPPAPNAKVAARATDATGMPIADQDMNALMAAINAM